MYVDFVRWMFCHLWINVLWTLTCWIIKGTDFYPLFLLWFHINNLHSLYHPSCQKYFSTNTVMFPFFTGSEPRTDNISPNTESPDATSSITTSLSHAMIEGQQLFVTITCYNDARQSSWKSSDGVTIVTKPPRSSAAVVHVKAMSETQYESRNDYQSQRNCLKASWDGFMDPFGIQSYQVMPMKCLLVSFDRST